MLIRFKEKEMVFCHVNVKSFKRAVEKVMVIQSIHTCQVTVLFEC